ncbi:MAG: hypothetical protein AAGK14_12835, partial [Verrucomicrobiota bacterium]
DALRERAEQNLPAVTLGAEAVDHLESQLAEAYGKLNRQLGEQEVLLQGKDIQHTVQLESVKSEYGRALAKLQESNQRSLEEERERAGQLARRVEESENQVRNMRERLLNERSQFAQLRKELESGRSGEIDQVAQQLNAWQQYAETEIGRLNSELEESRSGHQQAYDAVLRLQQQLAQAQAAPPSGPPASPPPEHMRLLQKEVAQLRQEHERAGELAGELEETRRQLQLKQSERDQAESRARELARELQEARASAAASPRDPTKTGRITNLESKLSQSQRDLSTARQEVVRLTTDLARAHMPQSLEREQERLRKRVAELEAMLKEALGG